MQQLQIPTVTIHDLAAFHHNHLCQSATTNACSPLCSTYDEQSIAEDGQEEDSLGYYPDGVKRTLTGEQIAMFRFSEAQQLLKQKQRAEARFKKGRNGAAEDAIDASEIPRPAPVSSDEARKNRLEAALWASKHDWDEFGNPIDAPSETRHYVAEVQGNAETGKTFLWPKIEN